jgi:GMP synthase-like glutamine amidotransferase
MRVAIIENMAGTPHGQVGVALLEAGAELDIIRPYNGDVLLENADSHDAIVVLGGEQSALDDAEYPYLPELAELMRTFEQADKAVLGICLGSQLLARAYGGQNRLQAAREFGWEKVSICSDGKGDPLFSGLGEEFRIFEWHADTFTLPQDAILLATNSVTANQAFRIGRAAYGTQFHFEASTDVVEGWRSGFEQSIEKMSPGWLKDYEQHVANHGASADAAGLAIARAWVKLI